MTRPLTDEENVKYWDDHAFECKKLYKMLYEKGLSQSQVQGMAEWFYRMIGKHSLSDCDIIQLQHFQQFANNMDTVQFDALKELLVINRQ